MLFIWQRFSLTPVWHDVPDESVVLSVGIHVR